MGLMHSTARQVDLSLREFACGIPAASVQITHRHVDSRVFIQRIDILSLATLTFWTRHLTPHLNRVDLALAHPRNGTRFLVLDWLQRLSTAIRLHHHQQPSEGETSEMLNQFKTDPFQARRLYLQVPLLRPLRVISKRMTP